MEKLDDNEGLINAVQNEKAIWDSNLNAPEEDKRRVALRSAPVTCATAVAHSLMQRLRQRARSKFSWITKKTSHPWTQSRDIMT